MGMRTLIKLIVGFAFLAALPSNALTVGFGGADDPSLHGAAGALTVEAAGANQWDVAWQMDFAGFDGDATHDLLTNVAFKAFANDSISSVSVLSMTYVDANGDSHAISYSNGSIYPSNVNNGGCAGTSNADFVCVDLNPDVSAINGGVFTARFRVVGGTLLGDEWSYRGKFGLGDGWVISESTPPIPEPTAMVVFGLGALIVGAALRKRARQ